MAITPEQRAQVVDLLADGLLVWQVAQRVGVGCRTVANINANWRGRILEMQRARRGLRVDGSPVGSFGRPGKEDAMADAVPTLRTVTVLIGDDGTLTYTLGKPEEALLRVELPEPWDAEALTLLCRRLTAMRDGALDALAEKIREGVHKCNQHQDP